MPLNSGKALYPQYKRDTGIIAQWLNETSKAHGFIGTRGEQQQASTGKDYTICIADFERMADFLSLKEHVFVPSYLRTSLSRAIRYRSTYGSYLQLQRHTDTPQDKTEDEKHLFFIDVLRNVQGTLNRISKPAAPVAPTPQTAPMTTRFASLDDLQPAVEDDTEDDESMPARTKVSPKPATVEDDTDDDASMPVRTKVSPKPPKDSVKFEPWEEDEEEALFQWRLFNMDLQHIRELVRQLWESYRAGDLSLEGVATGHNMAIYMVRQWERDILPITAKHRGYVALSLAHFVRRYIGTAVDAEEKHARMGRLYTVGGKVLVPTTEAIIEGFDIAEEEMFFAWQVLSTEAWSWKSCGTFSHYNGEWGRFIPRDDRQNMTSLEKYNQDKAVAGGIVNDIYILVMYLAPPFGLKLDELSAAVEDLVPWKPQDVFKHHGKVFPCCRDKISFRAVFATQLLLDSIHVLGTSVDRPWRELLDKTARISKSAKSLGDFYKDISPSALGAFPGTQLMDSLETLANFWQGKDPVTQVRQQAKNPPEAYTEEGCTFLSYNAPLCGWWMQIVQADAYELSITVAKSLKLPMACARLYFTFVQESLIPEGSWPDMDAFLTLHRGDIWVGAPKSGQYFRGWNSSEGASVVRLGRGARPGSQITNNGKFKTLTYRANVSRRVIEAFTCREVEGLSEEDLENFMDDTQVRWYNGKAVRPCFHHGWDKAGKYKGDRNPPETYNPFLRLAQAMDAEALYQSFDYMTFNRVCWLVLQDLIKKGRPILDAVCIMHQGSPDWTAAEGGNVYRVVGFILFSLFHWSGHVYRKEALQIADILLHRTKGLGRTVHTSTGIDWAEALKCTCADIPSSKPGRS
ncbi:hypothetical protein F4824DRAFT_518223 [Ustulina deusta]|nr:hypothetical protein F4824DRAFT_518223 [Ustulina deusta]